jgi:hypothetical protein
VLGLLRSERLAVKDSAFDSQAFGSWWIDVATDPPIRRVRAREKITKPSFLPGRPSPDAYVD